MEKERAKGSAAVPERTLLLLVGKGNGRRFVEVGWQKRVGRHTSAADRPSFIKNARWQWDGYFENEFCFEGAGVIKAKIRRRKIPAPNRTLPTRTRVPDSDKELKKVI